MSAFFAFGISFIFSVYITNIQSINALYIFLVLEVNCFIYWTVYKTSFKIILGGLLGIILGFIITFNNLDALNSNKIYFSNNVINKTYYPNITGEIKEIYSKDENSNSYILGIKKIDLNINSRDINILLKTSSIKNMEEGDIISFSSKISEIKSFSGFDYNNYMLTKGIYAETTIYNFELLGKNNSLYHKYIVSLRNTILETINKIYPGDSGKLTAGILLGARQGYSKELKNSFSRSGLSHIVAVSGYNITILIIFFGALFKLFPRFIKIPLTIAGIIIFLLLVGNNIPAIRSGIMGAISFIYLQSGKRVNIYSIALLTSIFLIIINPLIINYDLSFQLSFLALLGLITLGEKLKSIMLFLPEKFSIREIISSTFGVMLFTLPIMISNFGQISIISPISNLVALPLIPYSMLFSTISVICYYINESLGIIFGFIAYVQLKTILNIAEFMGGLKYASVSVNLAGFEYYFNGIYYCIISITVGLIYFQKIKKDSIIPLD